jgi:hypothetical protein
LISLGKETSAVIGQGKIVGIILIVGGLTCAVLYLLWGLLNMIGQESGLGITGFVLGLAIVFVVVVAPLVGAGVYLFVRGRREEAAFAEVAKEKKLLNMVQTRGQIKVGEAALELDCTYDQVKEYLYDLVGKGLFTGYVNWNDGILYSKEANQLRDGRKCPNCGAQLELGGKGVITCPYCGTDIFL